MTQNELDIITILESLSLQKSLLDRPAAALKRLLAQMPQAAVAEAEDVRPDGIRRKEFIAKQKQPATWVPPPDTEKPDGERRKDFIEKMKRPLQHGGT